MRHPPYPSWVAPASPGLLMPRHVQRPVSLQDRKCRAADDPYRRWYGVFVQIKVAPVKSAVLQPLNRRTRFVRCALGKRDGEQGEVLAAHGSLGQFVECCPRRRPSRGRRQGPSARTALSLRRTGTPGLVVELIVDPHGGAQSVRAAGACPPRPFASPACSACARSPPSVTESGRMFRAVPPWMLPTLTTAGCTGAKPHGSPGFAAGSGNSRRPTTTSTERCG